MLLVLTKFALVNVPDIVGKHEGKLEEKRKREEQDEQDGKEPGGVNGR